MEGGQGTEEWAEVVDAHALCEAPMARSRGVLPMFMRALSVASQKAVGWSGSQPPVPVCACLLMSPCVCFHVRV